MWYNVECWQNELHAWKNLLTTTGESINMNIYKVLVLIKSNNYYNNNLHGFEDKTEAIKNFENRKGQIAITYKGSDQAYTYSKNNVQIYSNPKIIDTTKTIVLVNGFPIKNSEAFLDFGEYIKIIYSLKPPEIYHSSEITYKNTLHSSEQPTEIINYFKELSSYVSVMEDGRRVLYNHYEKISTIREESVLSKYLSGEEITYCSNNKTTIFPFGLNLSQKEAVKAALENSISIIEGPPGTGKTQTILNIIANLINQGKTVAVVSGNNSATSNVQEKLNKNGYGFITALLGNLDKKNDFFENNQSCIPNIKDWQIENEQREALTEKLKSTSENLESLLQDQNKMAKLKEKLSKLETEQKYFEISFNSSYVPLNIYSFHNKWSSNSILDFIADFERISNPGILYKFITKVFLFFKYGIHELKFVFENQTDILLSQKRDYYISAIDEIKEEIRSLKIKLENKSFKELMKQYTEISVKLFNASLYSKYSNLIRGNYTLKSFIYNFSPFIKDYPVILSTTHSIISCIPENFLFDYLIIDEASQVDLVTAGLAFACCKNIVVVGDVKQLPQIVPAEIQKISDELIVKNKIEDAYNYSKYSIISSLIELYKNKIPRTLLSEHYRCHPKIIGFCNEKFYDNKLVIMTEENENDKPLKIYKTAPGNHARRDNIGDQKGWYNLRQIEVIRDEIINKYNFNNIRLNELGIISPYRKHVTEINRYIGKPEIEVDTVHKFQGREKDAIIFTTVANDINPFVDDPNLINVAVSRAVNELVVVTSNDLFKQHGTNIGDLMRYMEYNSLEGCIKESQKVSVFDLLYSDYSAKLLKIMNSSKNVSKFKSENFMYSVIEDVLAMPEFSSFKCVLHVPLYSLVKDFTMLNEEEKRFARNPWTHVDFLIFSKLDKESVLVVEVDGFEYHQNNAKQIIRDKMKDKILKCVGIPMLRFATNGSEERQKLIAALMDVVRESGEVNE